MILWQLQPSLADVKSPCLPWESHRLSESWFYPTSHFRKEASPQGPEAMVYLFIFLNIDLKCRMSGEKNGQREIFHFLIHSPHDVTAMNGQGDRVRNL